MTKDEYLVELHDMFFEMKPILVRAGVAIDRYELPDSELLDAIPEDALIFAYAWLKTIYQGTYEDAMKVYRLLPEEIWIRYALWGEFDEHRECVLLAEACAKILNQMLVKNRPELYKKAKHEEWQTRHKVDVKTAQTGSAARLGTKPNYVTRTTTGNSQSTESVGQNHTESSSSHKSTDEERDNH